MKFSNIINSSRSVFFFIFVSNFLINLTYAHSPIDQLKIGECTYNHLNWLGNKVKRASAEIFWDKNKLKFISKDSGEILEKIQVIQKFIEPDLSGVSFRGYFISPLSPFALLGGGGIGEKSAFFDFKNNQIKFESFMHMAGEHTFEKYDSCTNLATDKKVIMEVVNNKLTKGQKRELYPKLQVSFEFIDSLKITYYDFMAPLKLESDFYYSSTCSSSVDQEDQGYTGGDAQLVQTWADKAHGPHWLKNIIDKCQNFQQDFSKFYIGKLEVPPDYISQNLKLGISPEQKIYYHRIHTKVNGLHISMALDTNESKTAFWDCIYSYDFKNPEGPFSSGSATWSLIAPQGEATESCQELISRYKKNYGQTLNLKNEKSFLKEINNKIELF